MTQTTTRPTTARTAQGLLGDIGFVLAMTQKVKDGMGKPTPPATTAARVRTGCRQVAVAA